MAYGGTYYLSQTDQAEPIWSCEIRSPPPPGALAHEKGSHNSGYEDERQPQTAEEGYKELRVGGEAPNPQHITFHVSEVDTGGEPHYSRDCFVIPSLKRTGYLQ